VTAGHPTVAGLRSTLEERVGQAVAAGTSVALVDFPNYPNVGDSAIWLGTVAVLERLGCRVAYRCDQVSYSPTALDERLPAECPVLLQGGGNFGDLWPEHQEFREKVIRDLPHRPIVQLPVSFSFHDQSAAERARATVNGHERLTLMVRDHESLDYAAAHYSVPALLCPDPALGLAAPPRPPRPEADIVVLRRSDHEGLTALPRLPGARDLDWSSAPGEPGYSFWWEQKGRAARWLGRVRPGGDAAEGARQAVLSSLFGSLARQRVAFGFAVVGSGRALVTDRLHGHILALLLGVPHVILETGHGKVRGFYETFTRGIARAVLCEDAGAVEDEVRRLLAPSS
jgi:pyruvyl transferase EpsO